MASVEFQVIKETQNPQWVRCDLSAIFDIEGLQSLSDSVFDHREAAFTVDKTAPAAYDFPDFGANCLQAAALKHLCEELSEYLERAVAPVSDVPAYILMERRAVVWERAIRACQMQVYSEANLRRVVAAVKKEDEVKDEGRKGETPSAVVTPAEKFSGNDVLVELGVKTGLSVVFSLLKQAWAQLAWQKQIDQQLQATGLSLPVSASPYPVINLPNEVLRSVLGVLKGIPPLSLANLKALSKLSTTCLEQSTEFLDWTIQPDSWVDEEGKRLASEVILSLVLQRGSLNSVLEWAGKVLICLASYEGRPEEVVRPALSLEFCQNTLEELRQRTVSSSFLIFISTHTSCFCLLLFFCLIAPFP